LKSVDLSTVNLLTVNLSTIDLSTSIDLLTSVALSTC
jgi:hypothetical protein